MLNCRVMPHHPPPSALRPELVALALAMVAMFPRDAFAYLDPGTGSMVWQTALTLLFGAGIALRGLRHKLWARFTREKPEGPTTEEGHGGSAP